MRIRVARAVLIGIVLFVAIAIAFLFLLLKLPLITNKISIDEAIKLAQICQIKTYGKTHTRGIVITLVNGSNKYLEDKHTSTDHYLTYDQNYNQFFELANNSRTRCGFNVSSFIE